jgi:hypothetical protein
VSVGRVPDLEALAVLSTETIAEALDERKII